MPYSPGQDADVAHVAQRVDGIVQGFEHIRDSKVACCARAILLAGMEAPAVHE